MLYNPASIASDYKHKVSIAYRNQWRKAQGSPTTLAIGYEHLLSEGKAGLGLNVYHDRLGFDQITHVQTNYRYSVPISTQWQVSLGLKAGITQINTNFDNAVTPDPTPDPIHQYSNVLLPKAGVGIFINSDRAFLGVSMPSVLAYTQQKVNINDRNGLLSRHLYASTGYVFGDIEGMQYKPFVFFKYHKAAPLELDLGLQAWYKNRFSVGLSYRTGDALSGIVEANLNKSFTVAYAYDYTVSGLRNFDLGGAHEIVLVYTFESAPIKIPSIHKFANLSKF
jgi:type IX secretion system PorP/SprF family membrane protein